MRIWLTITLIFLSITIFGCSGSSDPLVPEPSGFKQPVLNSSHQLWGLYQVEVDWVNQTVEYIRLRDTDFHLNVISFLENTGCLNCFSLYNFDWGDHHLGVDVSLRHPFPGLTEFAGFDVRGIVMFNGMYDFPQGSVYTKAPGDGGLTNPDGYTNLYAYGTIEYYQAALGSGVPPSANLNGYIRHYHVPTRRMFEAIASPVAAHYEIDFPMDDSFISRFNYAVDASWVFPDNVPATIDDFPIDANCWEAHEITTSFAGEVTAVIGSGGTLNMRIYDWQGIDTISTVTVECPELFNGVMSPVTGASGNDPVDGYWLDASVDITNQLGTIEPGAAFRVLISARDTKDVEAPLQNITAYQIYEGTTSGNLPPVAVAEIDDDTPSTDQVVHFTGHNSYDPEDGPVTEYHWDLDGDGDFDDSIDPDPTWTYTIAATYLVDLKVYDSEGAWDILNDEMEIVVSGPPQIPSVVVTLQEYDDEGINHPSVRNYNGNLFTGDFLSFAEPYEWKSGPKITGAYWNFAFYGLPDTGNRHNAGTTHSFACPPDPWGSATVINSFMQGNCANLTYADYNFNMDMNYEIFPVGVNGTLSIRGWNGWDEVYSAGFSTEFEPADDILPTGCDIVFPLSIAHTGAYNSGSGELRWLEYDLLGGTDVCKEEVCDYTFEFDVIGEGTVRTIHYMTPVPCILTRTVYSGEMFAPYAKFTEEIIWYEWITEDGGVAAFLATFNNVTGPFGDPPGETRFEFENNYTVIGECVFAARST